MLDETYLLLDLTKWVVGKRCHWLFDKSSLLVGGVAGAKLEWNVYKQEKEEQIGESEYQQPWVIFA